MSATDGHLQRPQRPLFWFPYTPMNYPLTHMQHTHTHMHARAPRETWDLS
jgi:hypothetical protein